MYSEVKRQADRLTQSYTAAVLSGRNIGLEKESLRVNASGGISQTDHPRSLGCALTHSSITTDFSEALLEMVTPPCDGSASALDYLTGLHQYIVKHLPRGEHIWNTSMPCILRGGESVRIGEYGNSFSGQMKHAYRRGLALRYGRRMQAIAGIHFNYSVPEPMWLLHQSYLQDQPSIGNEMALMDQWHLRSPADQLQLRTRGYFSMMQNLLRVGWIIPFLFGASPAICTSFLADGEGDELNVWNNTTRFAPHGTSLRMGKIGYRYREDQPIDLSVRHTTIEEYIDDIIAHVSTQHPPYAELGLLDEFGERQQLSTSRLQIENEFYSTVRPKQIAHRGELPIHALRERGIRYLELRSVDVNLFEPAGIGLNDSLMLEMLMMFAFLGPSQALSAKEMAACTHNIQTVAHRGREPGLELEGPQGMVALKVWGEALVHVLAPIAQWLDGGEEFGAYTASLEQQRAKFEDMDLTPSARMVAGIKDTGSFFEFAQQLSRQHHKSFSSMENDAELFQVLDDKASQSCALQHQMEQQNEGNFDTFLSDYLNQITPDQPG